MKRLLPLFPLFSALFFSLPATAQIQLFSFPKPNVFFVIDNSGSMATTIDNTAGAIPGCSGNDCDADGLGGTREDYTIAILRSLLDTNGSASSFGATNSLDSNDSWNIQFDLLHYMELAPGGPPALDTAALGTSGTPANINPPNYCQGGAVTLRYRSQNETDYQNIESVLGSFRPRGWTALGYSLKYYAHRTGFAYAHFLANDPAVACRKKYVVVLTDGDDTCEAGSLVQRGQNAAQAALDIYNLQSPNRVKTFVVGFAAGLSTAGKQTLNLMARNGGTDANGDGDNNPATPNCTIDGVTACANQGNAFLVNNASQLTNALKAIFDQVSSGQYTFSLPQISLSGSGNGGVIASYFTINQYPDHPWTPGFVHKLLDTSGQPTVLKWDAVAKVGAQPSVSAVNARKNYALRPSTGMLGVFDESVVGTADFPVGNFFTPADSVSDDFDLNGTVGDINDARNIVRFLNGVYTRVQDGVTKLKFKIGAQPDATTTKWPFGSIVHSNALTVRSPANPLLLNRNGYMDYVVAKADRDPITIVGTNSIILAINDESEDDPTPNPDFADGEEMWGYVPRLLAKYRRINTGTVFLNDGKGIVVDYNAGTESTPLWRTGYFAGLGAGRKIVAINVTNTRVPGNGETTGNWEFKDNDLAYVPTPPTLIEVHNGADIKPVLVVPGGSYDSADTAHPLNARYVYFLDATNGALLRKLAVGNLSDANFVAYTPPGITAKVEQVDNDSDGFADQVFIGTVGGQIYAFNTPDLATIQSSGNLAQVIWEPREGVSNSGDGTNPVDCLSVGNCDMRNPTDYPVVKMVPYYDLSLKLWLAVYFGNPEGTDEENMADSNHLEGAIIRKVNPGTPASPLFNYIHSPSAPPPNNIPPFNLLRDPGGAAAVYGNFRLPRQLYVDSVNQHADRILSFDNMFVLGNRLHYLLYRPSAASCDSFGDSFFAALDLDTGLDAPMDPANTAPTASGADESTENYLHVTNAPASFVFNFITGKITFGYTKDTNTDNIPDALELKNGDINTPPPFSGATQNLMLM